MLKHIMLFAPILMMLAGLTACQSNAVTSKELSYQMACGTDLGKSLICTDENLKVKVVEGIEIGGVDGALFYNSTVKQNQDLQRLIKGVLSKDKNALKELVDFDCGGGAGCYDLGFIFSELVNKLGEDNFIVLASDLTVQKKGELASLLMGGLEYGYKPYSEDPYKPHTLETDFPKLAKFLENN